MTGFQERILEKLDSLQGLYGYLGLQFGVFALIIGLLAWWYLKKYFESYAESFFKRSLADYQKGLIQEVGQKFIEQKGNIDKEIANNQTKIIEEISKQFIEQKRDIDKDISHLQNDLRLITNQKSNFFDQQRDSIVEFYSCYDYWLTTILSFNPENEMNEDINTASQLYYRRVREAEMKLQMSSGKLDLYVQDDELHKLKNNLLSLTDNLKLNKDSWILEIKNIKASKGQNRIPRGHPGIRQNEIFTEVEAKRKELQTKMSAILTEILK